MSNDNIFLESMFWASIVIAIMLILASTITIGRYLADVEYQKAAKLNGVRWIQAVINLRTQANRVLLALVVLTTSIFGLLDLDLTFRIWINRTALIIVLLAFFVSSLADWFAERRQLQILMQYSEINKVGALRLLIHRFRNKLTMIIGLSETAINKTNDGLLKIEFDQATKDAIDALEEIQTEIRAMDPAYKEK